METTEGNGSIPPLEVHPLRDFDVPGFWVPSKGPLAAGLVFHVGRGNEPAALAGITHLIKHLALDELDYPAHGQYDPLGVDVTGFSHQGTEEEISRFLITLSSRLTVIPLERLSAIKTTLEEESQNWKPTIREQLLRVRHGSVGLGALTFPEYALRKAGHIQINAWAASNFQTSTAAVWFAGPRPAEIPLRLVRGTASYPQQHLLEVPTPGAIYTSPGEVAISQIAPRTHNTLAAVHIAEKRARRDLVDQQQVATSISFTTERLDANSVEIVVVAHAAQGRDNEVTKGILTVMDHLASEPPSIEEIDLYRNGVALRFFDYHYAPSLALAHAVGNVTSVPALDWPATYQELVSLTGESISLVFANAMETTLIAAHRSVPTLREYFQYVGNWSPTPVSGAKVKPIRVAGEGRKPKRELWFGPLGITILEDDRLASVAFSECVLLLRDHGGYRELVSGTGGRVVFLAEAWERGETIAARIDKEVVPERTLLLESADRRQGYVGAERRRWER